MGNVLSSSSTPERTEPNVISERETMNDNSDNRDHENPYEVFHEAIDEDVRERARIEEREKEMLEFYKQLNAKREQRKEILARHKSEKEKLQKALETEKISKAELSNANQQLRELLILNNIDIPEDLPKPNKNVELLNSINQMREEFENLRSNNIRLRQELALSNVALQTNYSEMAELSSQNAELFKHIRALKEVVNASKTMITLREQQLSELKTKLNEIEKSLADREANMLSTDLKQEYERQLQNIRTLRGLYEERARLAEISKQNVVRELDQQKKATETEIKKNTDLLEKIDELQTKVEELEDIIETKKNEITSNREETQTFKSEILVVNKLFSQVLLGYKSKEDLDKLVHRLEENHGLLTQMAERENDSEISSALPKLLLEIVSQVDEKENSKQESDENSTKEKEPSNATTTTPEEIVEKLPKVWKVLMELLSHQSIAEDSSNLPEKITTCYKSVETKSGPVLVPSVSQTYIRLKDLIVEKLSLVKEVNRIKQLNSHLETRLEEQEHRLCHVTKELSKTWHVVGRLRKHHHQLHTHEKILKYELQQKRKLLNELKEELEYCREKWEQAREKNSQSEKDWTKLRAEFSDRSTRANQDSFNNSAESGFSDNRPSDESSESNDESEYGVEPLMRKKKNNKKVIDHILDSSGDCHLAEREDPVSDLLDVAELPLDSHDGEDNQNSCISDSYNSENISRAEKLYEISEDEIGEISNDCVDDKIIHSSQLKNSEINQNTLIAKVTFDAAAIIKSVQEQNSRLAKKDKKLESLEKSSNSLLQRTQNTVKLSEQINSTLDHLLYRPTSSINNGYEESNPAIISETQSSTDSEIPTTSFNQNDEKCNSSAAEISETTNDESRTGPITSQPIASTSQFYPVVDFKAILENIERQNERLKKKDERLHTLEKACTDVVKKLSNTVDVVSEEIKDKIDHLHMEHSNDHSSESPLKETVEDDRTSRSGSEPSASSDIDHEAVFAARDRRLKRLEEQTKSLVKRVNKTNTKGVKINYKLDELHNIYGSESSRAGTPSEDSRTDDISQDPQPEETKDIPEFSRTENTPEGTEDSQENHQDSETEVVITEGTTETSNEADMIGDINTTDSLDDSQNTL